MSCLRKIVLCTIASLPAQAAPQAKNEILVDRVGDTGFIQLQAESFKALDARQQQLAYWLTQASTAIDPIIYDQLSRCGLRQKRLLEEIVARANGIDPKVMAKIADFAKLFWANRVNHKEMTAQKFLPAFTFDQLRQAALTAQKNGASRDEGNLRANAKVMQHSSSERSPSLICPLRSLHP